MVHRDVKPANILLADADDTKQIIRLIDLGGAAARTHRSQRSALRRRACGNRWLNSFSFSPRPQLCLGEPLAYAAGLGSFDPLYAPPEQFLLPEG